MSIENILKIHSDLGARGYELIDAPEGLKAPKRVSGIYRRRGELFGLIIENFGYALVPLTWPAEEDE